MTRDPKKFREIARVCTALSQSAVTVKERDTFATLAETWRGMAASTESVPVVFDQEAKKEDVSGDSIRFPAGVGL
jgi:hypothetical protein